MARAGILYADVASAAARLAADGINPTVDGVRAALGGTGSKSTLAPFVKRWKEEHQARQSGDEAGLPPALLQAVKALHGQLRDDADARLAQAQQRHDAALAAAAARETDWRARCDALTAECAASTAAWHDTAQRLEQLEQRHQQQSVALATAQAETAGAQQRLADRAAELANLVHQLNQARAQFEHFQQASAAQRGEERRAADQRLAQAAQELAASARQQAGVQAALEQQQAGHAALADERDALRASQRAMADEHAKKLAEKQAEQMAERARVASALREAVSARDNDVAQLQAMQGQWTETRMAYAAQERETRLLGQQLHKLQAQADKLAEEKLTWIRERVAMEELMRKER